MGIIMWKELSKMEKKKYPIYKFNATWDQDDFRNNGTEYFIMYKENPTAKQLEEELLQFKLGILTRHNRVIFKNAEYEFVEEESWCLGWFNHYTYNEFKTDLEIEESFRDYVARKETSNLKNGHQRNDINMKLDLKEYPYCCLMGAEDDYRWKICRCEHCTKLGKITIDH